MPRARSHGCAEVRRARAHARQRRRGDDSTRTISERSRPQDLPSRRRDPKSPNVDDLPFLRMGKPYRDPRSACSPWRELLRYQAGSRRRSNACCRRSGRRCSRRGISPGAQTAVEPWPPKANGGRKRRRRACARPLLERWKSDPCRDQISARRFRSVRRTHPDRAGLPALRQGCRA